MQLHSVIQQPGETVSDFMSRLRRAAKPLFDRKPILEKLEQIRHSDKEWSSELVSAVQEIGTGVKETMDTFLYHFFMRGLNDKIKAGLGTSEPKDIYEAQTLAERQERFLKLYGHNSNKQSVNVIKNEDCAEDYIECEDSEDNDDDNELEYKIPVAKNKQSRKKQHGLHVQNVFNIEQRENSFWKDNVHCVQNPKNKEGNKYYECIPVCSLCRNEGHSMRSCFFSGTLSPNKIKFAIEHGIDLPKPGSKAHNSLNKSNIRFDVPSYKDQE